ncbi:hypothetical protein [Vibrio sp. CAU 1672]|uniref:hypothetical protein n=1 Tax=Vibrio sp. CAU 1672 TaxID=3032594 RepID=UPI0023DC5B59|nr:hypothetical protein [Vibrio sp. CAU 1672]MDF2154644.1 hypothetical protein [Vibrio sp. CAU 1672]
MLWDTLERVNRLRQQALANPEFVQSAKEHEAALHEQENHPVAPRRHKAKQDKKSLADIYKQVEFGADARH